MIVVVEKFTVDGGRAGYLPPSCLMSSVTEPGAHDLAPKRPTIWIAFVYFYQTMDTVLFDSSRRSSSQGIICTCTWAPWVSPLRMLLYAASCAASRSFATFHAMQSDSLAPLPPKQSSALPMVRSTRPPLRRSTSARSSTCRAPPA